MNAIVQDWIVDNAGWAAARPGLSVLTPFLNDDPRPLLAALDREASTLDGGVELVLLDDGSSDGQMGERIVQAVQAMKLPARSIRLSANEGRSRGRNRLAGHARGRHLLFLDSDMLPDAPDFLGRYLALIGSDDPAVVFGGFSMDQAPVRPEHALHRQMAGRSDCAPASLRRQHPEKFVFTSNLLIRRDVFDTQPFDEGFKGWGWEDVEWGVRVSRSHAILHIDNPATHLGLDPAPLIARKYEQSAQNFGRILGAHPEIVRSYPTYRVGRVLKRLPLLRLWRPLLKAFALIEGAPLRLRAFSMRLYRVAVSADAI